MDMTSTLEGIKLLALRSGDRLAIMLPDDPTPEELDPMRTIIKNAWPDVPVVFFVGGIELAVVRSDA